MNVNIKNQLESTKCLNLSDAVRVCSSLDWLQLWKSILGTIQEITTTMFGISGWYLAVITVIDFGAICLAAVLWPNLLITRVSTLWELRSMVLMVTSKCNEAIHGSNLIVVMSYKKELFTLFRFDVNFIKNFLILTWQAQVTNVIYMNVFYFD